MLNDSNMLKVLLIPLLASVFHAGLAHAEEPALPEELARIESFQQRADILAFGELGTENYHLAKVRTFLDMALSEYYENEQIGIVTAILGEVGPLLDALEQKQPEITMETPTKLNGSESVRADLWKKISILKMSAGFSCAQRAVAEAEVHLIWAGHEKYESSWAHAKSYARSAEELIKEAWDKADICGLYDNSPAAETITLSSDTLFNFGNARLGPSAHWQLNRLVDRIKRDIKNIREIELIGHTDRLRSDNKPERNQKLSERRASSVKRYLIGKGIPENKIRTRGEGSAKPLVTCPVEASKALQIKCLNPNRRVEINLRMNAND